MKHVVHLYSWINDRWEQYEFSSRDEALHFVASYRVLGWTKREIYMEE